MARQITITTPEKYTEELISRFSGKEGLLSMAFQKNASLKPPGDIITILVTNNSLIGFLHLLENFHLGEKEGISINTSEPDSIISNQPDYKIEEDGQEAIWEEVEMVISKDSNMSINILILMLMSGAITATGLATSSIHILIGGMLVAPGFMPIMRISLGLVTQNKYWYRGFLDTFKGYMALMIGAVLTTALLRMSGVGPLHPEEGYYELHKTFVEYWTTVNLAGIISSAAATIVGAILLMTKRTIFSSGVMIALALVPAASLTAIALVSGEWELAGKAGFRFALDLGLVLVLSFLIFGAKQYWLHRRRIKL